MGGILERWRTSIAVSVAVVLIGGSFWLANSSANAPAAQASEESALLAAIANKDSDNDGLPDWEEALYGTDPKNSDTRGLGMTDGQAVAQGLIVPKAISDIPATGSAGTTVSPDLPPAPAEGTLTATFAQSIFTKYLSAAQAKGGALTEADLSDITNQALNELAQSIRPAPDFKSASDITISGEGPAAMKAFAASVETVMKANPSGATESELTYLKSAVEESNTAALGHIRSIAKSYRTSAAGIAALPAPHELAQADLALINGLARMSEIVNDLALVTDDPLAAMLALDQYPAAVLALTDALTGFSGVYRQADVTFAPGEPGAAVVNIVADVAAAQAAAKKP